MPIETPKAILQTMTINLYADGKMNVVGPSERLLCFAMLEKAKDVIEAESPRRIPETTVQRNG